MAYGIILLVLVAGMVSLLTWLQQREAQP